MQPKMLSITLFLVILLLNVQHQRLPLRNAYHSSRPERTQRIVCERTRAGISATLSSEIVWADPCERYLTSCCSAGKGRPLDCVHPKLCREWAVAMRILRVCIHHELSFSRTAWANVRCCRSKEQVVQAKGEHILASHRCSKSRSIFPRRKPADDSDRPKTCTFRNCKAVYTSAKI